MAYNGKHTWVTGETISASNLNNLEDGVSENKTSLETLATDLSGKIVEGETGFTITIDGGGAT